MSSLDCDSAARSHGIPALAPAAENAGGCTAQIGEQLFKIVPQNQQCTANRALSQSVEHHFSRQNAYLSIYLCIYSLFIYLFIYYYYSFTAPLAVFLRSKSGALYN
jgi:hypothetical protein